MVEGRTLASARERVKQFWAKKKAEPQPQEQTQAPPTPKEQAKTYIKSGATAQYNPYTKQYESKEPPKTIEKTPERKQAEAIYAKATPAQKAGLIAHTWIGTPYTAPEEMIEEQIREKRAGTFKQTHYVARSAGIAGVTTGIGVGVGLIGGGVVGATAGKAGGQAVAFGVKAGGAFGVGYVGGTVAKQVKEKKYYSAGKTVTQAGLAGAGALTGYKSGVAGAIKLTKPVMAKEQTLMVVKQVPQTKGFQAREIGVVEVGGKQTPVMARHLVRIKPTDKGTLSASIGQAKIGKQEAVILGKSITSKPKGAYTMTLSKGATITKKATTLGAGKYLTKEVSPKVSVTVGQVMSQTGMRGVTRTVTLFPEKAGGQVVVYRPYLTSVVAGAKTTTVFPQTKYSPIALPPVVSVQGAKPSPTIKTEISTARISRRQELKPATKQITIIEERRKTKFTQVSTPVVLSKRSAGITAPPILATFPISITEQAQKRVTKTAVKTVPKAPSVFPSPKMVSAPIAIFPTSGGARVKTRGAMRIPKLSFSRSKKKRLPTADLPSISASIGKYGKATFARGREAEISYRKKTKKKGVFATFPTAEQIKGGVKI